MEPLLAVPTAIDPRTKQYSERIQREAVQTREAHPSTGVEREEEQRWEVGVGSGGAFGDRKCQGKEGMERSVWEWRDEDAVLEASEAMEAAKEAAKKAARGPARSDQGEGEGERVLGEVAAAEEAFPTPLSHRMEAVEQMSNNPARAPGPSTITGTSVKTTVFRFVDISSRGMFQDKHVQKGILEREKAKARKAKRRDVRV